MKLLQIAVLETPGKFSKRVMVIVRFYRESLNFSTSHSVKKKRERKREIRWSFGRTGHLKITITRSLITSSHRSLAIRVDLLLQAEFSRATEVPQTGERVSKDRLDLNPTAKWRKSLIRHGYPANADWSPEGSRRYDVQTIRSMLTMQSRPK